MMELKKASWDLVPQILPLLKRVWPDKKTSYYMLRGHAELRKKYKYDLLTPGGMVDKHATFVIVDNHPTYYGIYTETMNPDLKPLITAMAKCREINWSRKVLHGSVHSNLFPVVHGVAEILKLDVAEEPAQSYHLSNTKARAITYEVPQDVYLGKVTAEHAPLVNELWPHNLGKDSLSKVGEYIQTAWNVGIFKKESNKLVAWCLYMESGGAGLLQVIDEEKRKGYGELALRALTKHCGDEGIDPVAFIDLGNVASSSLFKKLGYEPGHFTSWFYTTPKTSSAKKCGK